MDEAPSLVVAIPVAKLRLSNAHRSCSSDSVSVSIRRGNWRVRVDLILILVYEDKGIYLRDHVEYWDVIGDLEQSLKNRVVQDGLLHVHKVKRVLFAGAGVPA